MNTLFFLCPDDNNPIGGIKVLYRHVDILNRNGFQAAIVHQKKGFRCTWFENQTRVEYHQRLNPDPFDFAVIPEIYGPHLAEEIPAAKKVVFNQNASLTFKGYSFDPQDLTTAYRDPSVIAAMVVSEDSRKYLAYVFPELKVSRIHISVDTAKFRFRKLADKRRRIAFLVRKHADDARQVINILKFRGALSGWDVTTIHDRTENQVAEILEDSMIFLSFDYPEGSHATLEAMVCGNLVVGYRGHGGWEVLRPEFSWPMAMGDVAQYAKTVESIFQMFRTDPSALQQKATAASEFVFNEYSPAREERDVLQFWDNIMFEQGHDAIVEA